LPRAREAAFCALCERLGARLYYRLYLGTRVGDKHLCVVVKVAENDAFVPTATEDLVMRVSARAMYHSKLTLASNRVVSVILQPGEEVAWIWTSTPGGASYVSGYTIVKSDSGLK
jgi:predicted short-subunit dehydrogenase-like oxidoreductase (DUF2520 family)